MIDLNDIAITVIVAALCHGDHAAGRRVDRSSFTGGNVDAEMFARALRT